MSKVYFILGLGMIGSSYAKKLSSLGYTVYGYDIDKKTNKEALKRGYIKDYGLNYIKKSDNVILTLYPEDNFLFIKDNLEKFNNVSFITDVSGVKENLINKIKKLLKNKDIYLSHHPMAGSEKSGINATNEKVFKSANFLIVSEQEPNEVALKELLKLKEDLGFAKATIITPKEHDLLISFTSQLPHTIAVSLVNSDIFSQTKDFAGDSYKDLTRIANINEKLWTELFFSNRENLIEQMERFNQEFTTLIELLKQENKEELIKKLKSAKEKRRSYD